MHQFAKKTDTPLVSVCIPTYNASRFIKNTISSVIDSTYGHFEIIVYDDASTDGTDEIVAGIDDPRIHFFRNEKNLGPPISWNRALEKASGKYVGLLNHDDLYGPFFIAFAVHHLESRPQVGWVTTAYRIIDVKGRSQGIGRRFPETREYNRAEVFLSVAKFGAIVPVYIARRDAIKKIKEYCVEAGPYADHDLHLRLAASHPMFYSHNPMLAAKRRHANNLTHQVRYPDLGMRAVLSLQLLHRVVRGDGFPEDLEDITRLGHTYLYDLIKNRLQELLERGEAETVQRIIGQMPGSWPWCWKTTREEALSQ